MFKSISIRNTKALEAVISSLDDGTKKYNDLRVSFNDNNLKISRRQGPAILSGFFPIFVGTLKIKDGATLLSGYFRFHMIAVGLLLGFIGSSLINLFSILAQNNGDASVIELLLSPRALFELQFSGLCILVAIFAWLGGKPFRQRIQNLIIEAFE